jgi:hypothetical protein
MPFQWHPLGFLQTSLEEGGCSRIPYVEIKVINIIVTYLFSFITVIIFTKINPSLQNAVLV